MPEDPYYVRLRRLREERGLSRPNLYRLTKNVGLDTLVALEREPKPNDGDTRSRARYPSPETIADIAEALDVSPDEFPEYRLAMARRALDERAPENNLDSALETLEVFKVGSLAHQTKYLGMPADVAISELLNETKLDHSQMVKAMKRLAEHAAPSINLEAVLAEALTPSEEAAATRYRARLREAAQHTHERPEDSPETTDDQDAQETTP